MKKRNIYIKTICDLFLLSCLVFAPYLFSGCNNDGPAELTIKNNSSLTLENVYWRDTPFGNISPTNEITKTVTGIDSPVFVRFHREGIDYTTKEEIKVEKGSHVTFIFTDDTIVEYFK